MSDLELSVTCESTGLVLNVKNLILPEKHRVCYLMSECGEGNHSAAIQKISLSPNIENCFFSVENGVSYTIINELDEDSSMNPLADMANVSLQQKDFTIKMLTPEF